jgi:hypothetical protein
MRPLADRTAVDFSVAGRDNGARRDAALGELVQ